MALDIYVCCERCGKSLQYKEMDRSKPAGLVPLIRVSPCRACARAAEEIGFHKGRQDRKLLGL